MAQTVDELREYQAAYHRRWRQEQKGKPKPKRKRPVGRPRLPKTSTALDPRDFEQLADHLARGWARGRRWMFSAQRYGWPQGDELFIELEGELLECAFEQLEAICRRAPKLTTASPKTYVSKSLARRCLSLFERILIEQTWGIEDALQRTDRVLQRDIRQALMRRYDAS